MTAYYPSQAGYPQPMGMPMGQPYGVPASYATPYDYGGYGAPVMSAVPTAVAAPVMMQPSYGAYGYNHFSWGNRLRRFFGLAPNASVQYKRDYSTWGFMGYSRRQRYVDAISGGEVDRQGRPVFRI